MLHFRLLILGLLLGSSPFCSLQAQTCGPTVDDAVFGSVLFNYGSATNVISLRHTSSFTVGQPSVGSGIIGTNICQTGFWSRYQVPPLRPFVTASKGEVLDRIEVNWAPDPLGATPESYKLYRNGVFLVSLDAKTSNYNDFNVIAGKPYTYTVLGVNQYGEGRPGSAIGFQVPNGVITGLVQTANGAPVPDVQVSLMPLQGFSAKLGGSDGAFAVVDTSFIPTNGGDWTLTFWMKTTHASAESSVLRMGGFLFEVDALASSSGQEGIKVIDSGGELFSVNFPDSLKNDWHHVAISYAAGFGRLYLDGVLVAIREMAALPYETDLNIGATGNNDGWDGRLDELRIYHARLDEIDLAQVQQVTASSTTEDLAYYWKMDEEKGIISYDIVHRKPLTFCGNTAFDADRPTVCTAGRTNESGYYKIEGVSYGSGLTFLASPSKFFYKHRALKFERVAEHYATLPDFSLTAQATLELWINSAGPDGNQCVLSKRWGSNDFQLTLVPSGSGIDNRLQFYLNGTQNDLGNLGTGYQHLAFTMDSTAGGLVVSTYKNGDLISTNTYPGVNGNWSDTTRQWVIGARPDGASYLDFFGGLVDEIALYDTLVGATEIFAHAKESRDPQERGLRVYFALDEGSGTRLNNAGSLLLGNGTMPAANWSPFSPNQATDPHIFTPGTRQVTLNPSVTSVDQVDFIDQSTISVSGFARYAGTDCFAENVEVLVNGASYNPPVYTDSTGKFIVELDPGTTAILTPTFEDHVFVPASWEVTNIATPIAGVLFSDVTTRKISGKVVGGACKLPIIDAPGTPSGTVCTVRIRSLDGCLERLLTVDNEEGNYEFADVPPIECTVSITEFSDPTIKTAFQVAGGSTVDLTSRDTVLDFVYFAPPQVSIIAGLDPFSATCSEIVLEKGQPTTIQIKVQEQYLDAFCDVDTAAIRIIDGFSDQLKDTTLSNGLLRYKFVAGNPNPAPPYKKTLQVVATTLSGNESSYSVQAIITGLRNKANTFTTSLPETPELILHDPPGDASYAYLEKDSTFCTLVSSYLDYQVGAGVSLTWDNGPDIEIVTAPLGIGTIQVASSTLGATVAGTVTYQKITDNSFQVCKTYHQAITTSGDELVVGAQGGDVFMGGGLNIDFGFADEVYFNDTICSGQSKVVLSVEPKEYATTFIYSEWNIRNNVLRYLRDLSTGAPEDSVRQQALTSIERWNKILATNDSTKAKATTLRNISFDAGAGFEYSYTSDDVLDNNVTEAVNSEGGVTTFVGFEVLGVGLEAEVIFTYATSAGGVKGSTKQKTLTTGYVLGDNDPGDAISVDIATDPKYNTPVFRIKAGQTSCPWEPGTAHRDGANLALRDNSTAVVVDVPANEPAIYKFTLGNVSETNENRTYAFTTKVESNPDGAIIKLNGAPLNGVISYGVDYGESVPITLTLERGPEAYDYDSLEIAFYTECEDDRAGTLGLSSDADTIAYDNIFISAHFIRPCSEVAINVPEVNWVLFPDPLTAGPDDIMRITVSGYDKSPADFEKIRLQYRRSNGDGAWNNIVPPDDPSINVIQPGSDILKANLGATFTQFYWNTIGLSDGPYEIRAIALCTGDAADKPGYSQIIQGRIDREPPSLVGTPQPSDGVYHVGDEISFTFNKPINCNKLIPADLTQPNNVALYDATTNTLIDMDATCYENKIIIDPNFQNKFFENKILRAELHDIEDLTGNKSTYLKWEFYVDRNELGWLTDSIGMSKYLEDTKTMTASIHNRGGYPVPFEINSVPAWIQVVPNKGTLAPNESRAISFIADSSLAFGHWADSVVLHTVTGQNPFFMGGDEGLPVGVRVLCRPPDWNISAGLYENSMNLVLEVNILGVTSNDPEDVVGAFINGQLRGRANIQYVPELNKYLAYLTVYGNSGDNLKMISLQVWDASACNLHGAMDKNFLFQPDVVVGSPLNPQLLHTNSYILRAVPLGLGYNWLSFNLAFPDNNVNAALASLSNPDNDLMKSQTQFATYAGAWYGSLTTLNNTKMYVYRADAPDTLQMLGNMIDPATTPIALSTGWNWIGYVPNNALPINEALATVPAQPGDLIKSQTAFAQFINGFYGWIGNLKYLEAPYGYQIKLSSSGTLTYPANPFTGNAVAARGNPVPTNFWTVNATQFENNATLIGMLQVDGLNSTGATMEIGAFVGNEVRGAAQAVYIEPLHAYLFFLTCYANIGGEQMHFKLFDQSTGAIQDLQENMYFVADQHQGSIEAPVPFHLKTSGTQEVISIQSFDIQPNPFNGETKFRFVLPQSEAIQLRIADVQGRIVAEYSVDAQTGLNIFSWDGKTRAGAALQAGVYFVRLETGRGSVTRKVVLQR